LRFADHFLQGDVDDDGTIDFEVHVNSVALRASDFIL
jgi:hypothetical protein